MRRLIARSSDEEDWPQRDLESFHQRDERLDVVDVVARDRRVDLRRQTERACGIEHP